MFVFTFSIHRAEHKVFFFSFVFFMNLQRHVLQAASFLVLNYENENRGVSFVMSFCLTKMVSLVSELFKIKWEQEQKWKRTEAETAFYGVSDSTHCRGKRFDEEQEHPLSSEATYRWLSEELDILNPHYLSHISQKSWWNDRLWCSKPSQENKWPTGKMEMFLYWNESQNGCLFLVEAFKLWQLLRSPNENIQHIIKSLCLHWISL